MSNPGIEQSSDTHGDALSAVDRRWGGDDRLGPLLAAADRALLILDDPATTVLHASPAAARLRSGIAGADGRLDAGLGLGEQIRRAGIVPARPSLVRIQFDRRRLQPPVTCLVAQASRAGGAVLALILTGRLPRLRPLVETAHEPEPTPEPQSGPDAELAPAADGPSRFTWRSDGGDRIDAVSGPVGSVVRAAMAGRSWRSLAESRVLTDAEGLLAALAARRTFRAVPLVLRRPAPAPALELELSGAPLARAGQPFAGYGGFGLLRPLTVEEPSSEDPSPEEPAPVVAVADAGTTTADAPDPRPGPVAGGTLATALADSHLSGDEHDAFREIARALGARFAGDAAPPAVRSDGAGGYVMPFPMPASRSPVPPGGPDGPVGEAVAILDSLPAAILICRDGLALFANRRLLALGGFADLAGITASGGLARLFHGLSPEDLTRSEAPLLLATREGGSTGVTVARSAIAWEGTAADLLLVREAEAAVADAALAAARVTQDFAGRRSAESAAILDSLDDGILTVDAGGRILSLNRPAASLFGLDPREVVGAGIGILFASESATEILLALAAPTAALGGRRDALAMGGDGPVPVSLRLLPLHHGPDRTAVLVLRDARVVHEADGHAGPGRRAAEAVSALRSDVLAKISHEIRTPMNGILGFAEAMLSEQFGPFENERYRDCLRDIRLSGEHVLNVVTDLLDLASIEAGRRDLAFTDVPLNEIVSNCVVEMQPQAARDRIVIRTSFSEDLTRLVADERSVRQAARYVIANAIRFTEAGGQVIVSTTMADRGEIALRVRDTGSGMTPDEIATALEPYRNVATSFPKAGTGLGLTITKALVEANRGRFRITSRKDEGTLVEMLFPTAQALSA